MLTTGLLFIRKDKTDAMKLCQRAATHLSLLAATAYWVLQSSSPLLAAFIFFSSFCSCSSAARISFGFWYCRTERKALSTPVQPVLQVDQLGPSCQAWPFCYQLPPKHFWRGGAITLGTFAKIWSVFYSVSETFPLDMESWAPPTPLEYPGKLCPADS